MMVDYHYYTEQFLGESIPQEAFPRLERQAENYLNYITQAKALSVTEEKKEIVKDCICALAEYYQTLEDIDKKVTGETEKIVSSVSVGTYSISYDTSAQSIEKDMRKGGTERQKRLYTIAKEYLAWTGLLYKGVRECATERSQNTDNHI